MPSCLSVYLCAFGRVFPFVISVLATDCNGAVAAAIIAGAAVTATVAAGADAAAIFASFICSGMFKSHYCLERKVGESGG